MNSLEIRPVGIKVNKGTHDGGKTGLDTVQKVYMANSWLFDQPILLLYDCDTNKQKAESKRLWVRLIPENAENTKVKNGIENLFPMKLFKDCFYDEKIKERSDGGEMTIRELNKPKLCRWICEDRKNANDFANFDVIVDILKEFVKVQQ